MIDKVVASFDEAVRDIGAGALIHVGGLTNPPTYLVAAIARRRVDNLTLISCSLAGAGPIGFRDMTPEQALRFGGATAVSPEHPAQVTTGLLFELGLVRKGITSFATRMSGRERLPFEALVEAGSAEVELNSQGTLAERIRAAKAGIAAFYTRTGVDTPFAAGHETREFGGVAHVMETALYADFAVIRAHAADRFGNLVYDQPASFNHTMAGAARVTIAEVEHVVALGELAPQHIKTPGVFVDRVVQIPEHGPTSWEEPC